MQLYQASHQWATRPDDQKFHTIEDALKTSREYAESAVERADINPAALRCEAEGKDVVLLHKGGIPAKLTHWAFGQLAGVAAAPAGYLRRLPPTLASQNLNYGLAERFGNTANPKVSDASMNLLLHSNGSLVARAITSERYSRIWNYELLEKMRDLHTYGWENPVPFEFVNGTQRSGEKPAPTIYVSDHDMFVFQVNNQNRIAEPGNPSGLGRGFFVENSEVGAARFRLTTFLYRYICGNHMVWGAENVNEIAVRHVGSAHDRMLYQLDRLAVELKAYENSSASMDEARVKAARSFQIKAADKDALLDKIFSMLKGQVTRTTLQKSYDLATEHELTDGDPYSAWGFAQGMTRFSQTIPYTDERVKVDRAAGRVLAMAF
jgi:hypothetical protein